MKPPKEELKLKHQSGLFINMKRETTNRTIAKNTLFLYFRMMITMLISLYTSRVILQKLGVDNYGLYQAVGGIVGFMSFISGTLESGSSRFITCALGEDNEEKLKRTFCTALNVHIIMAFFTAILAETVGLWFLYNKMVIPPERMTAAIIVYHLSIVSVVLTITQVPYNSSIIAHEHMSIYAYMSIWDACAKLGVCFLLALGNFDRLILYAVLLLVVQSISLIIYRLYCVRHFTETRYSFIFDKKIFRDIIGLSGWSLFAGGAIALNNQGMLILLNNFFNPAVVAARAISLQVNSIANQFVANFRQAANPQIVKKFAAGDLNGSKKLLLSSTKYSFYMMYILSLPICLLAKPLLTLWLGIVPEYAVLFLQIVIVQSLFQVFDTSFYTALFAKGRLKENALTSPTIGFLIFPITYVLFKLGCSPLALSWTSLTVYAILGLVQKPIIITKICGYKWAEIIPLFVQCFTVVVVSFPLPLFLLLYLNVNDVLKFFIVGFACVLCVGLAVWLMGLDLETRHKIIHFLRSKINKKLVTNQ